jgi:hypothetical protein
MAEDDEHGTLSSHAHKAEPLKTNGNYMYRLLQ